MGEDTRQQKRALAGLQAILGEQQVLEILTRVMHSGKHALAAVMIETGHLAAERVMLIERKEIAGLDYYPRDQVLQKWVHKEGAIFIGDQKGRVKCSCSPICAGTPQVSSPRSC